MELHNQAKAQRKIVAAIVRSVLSVTAASGCLLLDPRSRHQFAQPQVPCRASSRAECEGAVLIGSSSNRCITDLLSAAAGQGVRHGNRLGLVAMRGTTIAAYGEIYSRSDLDSMGRTAREWHHRRCNPPDGAPHATAKRFEQIPHRTRTRCNVDRRDRDGPVELAGRRYRAGVDRQPLEKLAPDRAPNFLRMSHTGTLPPMKLPE